MWYGIMPPTTSDNEVRNQDSPAGLRALDSIRNRVRAAADEITRLRAENDELRRLLEQARARPAIDPTDLVFRLSEDPDELRRAIDDYIEMLDLYIGSKTDTSL